MNKRIIHVILALLYIGAIAISVLFVIKPGASIFHYKMTLDNQSVTPDAGRAFRYDLKVSPFIFRTGGILVYEDGNQLNRTDGNIVVEEGTNTYSLSETSNGLVHIYFAASDNSSPITNGRKYTLYLPTNFASRPMGIIYLVILLPGFAWFLYFALAVPNNRKILVQSPAGSLIILDRFFENFPTVSKPNTRPVREQIKTRTTYWKKLFTITILLTYFFVLMEWIFFITKPSFMSMMSVLEKADILILASLFLSLLSMVAIATYIIIDILMLIFNHSIITRYMIPVIPTFIISTLALLMIDNFTYTIFKFGISTSIGIWRVSYALLYLLLFVIFYKQMQKYFNLGENAQLQVQPSNRLFYLANCILIISIGLALISINYGKLTSIRSTTNAQQATKLPNIILLGSDGVNADNMSVYGYMRDTTPRIRELAGSSLVAENAFTNSSNTAGSIISIFTSKIPTQTRVVYAPDILTGENAYQHLPGLLKLDDYTAVEFGVQNYVDAFSRNMQYGFDTVNGITHNYGKIAVIGRCLGYDNVIYFLYQLTGRISDRLQHIFFIRDIQNPYRIVTQPVKGYSDQEKINQTLDIINQSQNPVFVHTHLMGTHGAKFTPPIQVFSKGEQQDQNWMVDFYDDAILSFDDYVGEVIDRLKADGEYENTILIIYSDHGMQYDVNSRIPLIIHFPGDSFTGRITQNVQNLDIAPTILDYMGLSIPSWMDGRSLLKTQLDSHYLIFSAGTSKLNVDDKGFFSLDPEQVKPPFYQFNFINIVDCQRWHQLDLISFKLMSGDISGYPNPCSEESLLTADEIRQAITQQLTADGFDISSLVK